MKALEGIIFSVLEFFGFEGARFALGDLFPGALVGFVFAAAVGGAVSDWKYGQDQKFISELPWDWLASVSVLILSIYIWYLIDIA